MKHTCSVYLFLIFSLITHNAWGQTPDSTKQVIDTTGYPSVVSDRINEADERERGPSVSKLMKKANESFGKKNYYAAMKYYSFVLKPEPLNVEALKGYGESAFAISSLDSAESAFQRMVDHGVSPSPKDYFPIMRLADVKFRKGQYSQAEILYNNIVTLPQTPPVTDSVKRKAAAQLELCLWAQGAGIDNPYIINGDTSFLLDTAYVNTRELYSEYVATIQEGQLYFSAYRFDFKKDKANPKRNTVKILKAEDARKKLGPSDVMSVSETDFNDLKRQHTAHLTFSESGNTAFFALGDYVGDSAHIRFDLYRRTKLPGGNWSLPAEKLNAINSTRYTTTEPSFGILPGDSTGILFFVSDRPGGKGGRDIWYSRFVGDSLTPALPLAEINTPGDDVTPFYHTPSGTLFFSTDSLPTLGGFDTYKTRPITGGHWKKPEHMGTPINSSANDVFFVLDKDSQRGFFSSNRIGGTNYSEEGCCYDIYSVDFVTRYRAIALHDITHKSLPLTRISLFEVGRNGQFIPIASPVPVLTSSYVFSLKLNQKYALIGDKEGFISDTVYRKAPSELWTSEIVDTLYLRPLIKLIASVYDADTKEPILGATTTFFDLGYKNKLGSYVGNDGPGKTDILPKTTNTKIYNIDFEHNYQVLAAMEGYVAETSKADSSEVVSTIGLVDGDTIEVDLFLHRPSVLEQYLPITLFFDNDYPKKDHPDQDTILLDYQKTFVGYIRKQDEFKEMFTNVLSGQKKLDELDSIGYFFEKEVRMNWDSFFSFSDKIDLMLQNGDTIILTLKGYASPLSNPGYNFHLTNRRIASVYNHFMIFDGGIFTKYREVGGNRQLRFLRVPNGDATAPPNMNKDPKNRRLSVYDYKVSRERRVQIVGAKVSKGSRNQKNM